MVLEQVLVLSTLFVTLVLFIWERWRYDVVAIMPLLFLTIVGLIPPDEAFSGFGHPAVITVAAILVVSKGLQNAGVVDLLAAAMNKIGDRLQVQLFVLVSLTALVSGFMNNIGALAVLMPVAIQTARKYDRSPSVFLMPMAFASLLGGMTTLIGTPPNIIISSFRGDLMGTPFSMFDFSPVGAGLAIAGSLFLSFIGWRLIPIRKGQASSEELFEIEHYVTELRVPKKNKLPDDITLGELESLTEGDLIVIGLVRHKQKLYTPSKYEQLRAGDILVAEANPESLNAIIESTGMELLADKEISKEMMGNGELHVMEVVIAPGTWVPGRTAQSLHLRQRFGVNLLAVARQGHRIRQRFNTIQLRVGDILLLRGTEETMQEAITTLGCLPLASREMQLGIPRRLITALGLFIGAVTCTVMNFVPIHISFVTLAVIMVLMKLVPIRNIYSTIDWPIIILLGAMFPVGTALETSGAAQTLATEIVLMSTNASPQWILVSIFVGTIVLSSFINNAAAAVLMAPVAVKVAQTIHVSADPFLMTVAVGASCAFLTPIGHQSNALVMGPGGYRFGDYWKPGLPVEMLIVIVGTPLILFFWPL